MERVRERDVFRAPLALRVLGTMLIVIFGPGAAVVSAHAGGSITLEGVAACNGLIVLIARPPLLRFSVSAAAIVLPKRYATGIPSTTRGLPRR